MNKLQKHKFADLYEMSSGISTKASQAGHGSPFVSFTTVFNNHFLPDSFPDLMDTSEIEQETYSVKEGDVFLTRTSETIDELGMSCVAAKDYPGATYSGFLKRLRPLRPDLTYAKYMAFYLRGNLFRKAMNNNAVMTLRCSLNEQIFSYLDLLLPSYKEQVSIGDFLYLIQEKIALNRRINSELEGMAKLLYDYWFVQYDFPLSAAQAAALGKPRLAGQPYRTSGGKMVYDSQLKREIPKGWVVGSLNCLGEIVGGSTPSTKEDHFFSPQGTPWITPKDLSRNTGNKFITRGEVGVTDEGIKGASLTLLPAGTVLMSSRAPIGYTAIARNPVTTNQGFKSFVPSKGYSTEFIYYTLNHLMKTIEQNASGSTFKEVSGGTLKSIQTQLPEPSNLSEFSDLMQPIFSQQDNLERQNQELTTLRDWLLPMLMNGQVRVTE